MEASRHYETAVASGGPKLRYPFVPRVSLYIRGCQQFYIGTLDLVCGSLFKWGIFTRKLAETSRLGHGHILTRHLPLPYNPFNLKRRTDNRTMACTDFLSEACVVLPVVGEGKGGGVVAKQAIPRGTLLARQPFPLAWATRAAPECGSCGVSSCRLFDRHHATTVTACDFCLRPYDHKNSRYADILQECVKQGSQGAQAKRCSRCRSVYYCSVSCQREAWPSHKEECAIFKGTVQWMDTKAWMP